MGLGIDIIIFGSAILFGIFLYWRESNGNGAYRFINKIMNSKELQMSADNPKGFIYKQPFIPRLLFVVITMLVVGLILQFLTPIEIFSNYFALSGFATFATGTIIGTYLANFVIKTTEVVEEKSELNNNIPTIFFIFIIPLNFLYIYNIYLYIFFIIFVCYK